MPIEVPNQLPGTIRWTSRLAIFASVVLLTAAILHRLGLPTPAALNMVLIAFALAALAFLLGAFAAVSIWRQGGSGVARVVAGLFISSAMFGGVAVLSVLAGQHPVLNDVTTDTQSPPAFVELARQREASANSPVYPAAFAAVQQLAYPDLKTLNIERPRAETLELTIDALKRQRYQIVSEGPDGTIEAVDRTLILGFYDDIAVRVTGDDERASVDVRSASRYGVYDFGQNASRVRTILREIVARLEETVPAADGVRTPGAGKTGKPGSKQEPERGSKKPIQRKSQDREKSGALREPEPKGSPQAKAGARAPDKRSAQSPE